MRSRLLASYLAITVFTLAVLVYPLGRLVGSRERDRLLRDIEQDATVVAGWAEDALESGVLPALDDQLAAYAADPGGRIVIVDASGVSVADSARPGEVGISFANRPEIAAAIQGRRVEGSRHSDTLDAELLYVALPVASSGIVHGAVRITYLSSALHQRIRDTWLGLGALSVAVLLVVTGIGVALARLVTQPVDRLEEAARRIAAGDLSARAPTDEGAPELRELATIFNETAARLGDILDAQQAFVADASHQLRTPLAALRLQLENIESSAPAGLQPSVASARAETARLSRISEALLALARSAAGPPASQVVDLADVATERLGVWAPLAAEAGVTLDLVVPSAAPANVVPGSMEQILDNLLDNALEVSPTGSRIRLEVVKLDRTLELHVVDEGPGLSEEERQRAFDRFWRGPRSEPGGTGLGLAIVAQLAARCGGRAELRPAPGGGLDAVVSLPSVG